MSGTGPRRLTFLVAMAALTSFGCHQNAPASAQPAPMPAARVTADAGSDAAAPEASPVPGAVGVTLGWIGALRNRDRAELVKRSRVPFVFRDTGSEVGCKSGTPADAAALANTLKCLTDDQLLAEDLKGSPHLQADVINRKRPPRWARRWMNDITPEMTAVSVFVPGNGDAFDFVFLVVGDRVAGLLKQVTFEKN